MNDQLRLALVHPDVRYKAPEVNRAELIRLNRQAAEDGARIILNTEMAVSGYSFLSRMDIRDYTETDDGLTISGLAGIARQYGVYICIGLAERDADTDIFYNSAIVLGPDGRIILRYRKINGEMRWACPGDSRQPKAFETPWGKVGVLICSDTYYGLMPRQTALCGIDLLLVPANWPQGGLNPGELWQARAVENGIYLAACNRTGQDRTMACHQAASCVIDPAGRILLEGSSETSQVFMADIPLDQKSGQLKTDRRRRLASRCPAHYRSIYLDMRLIDNLTPHYELPEPGKIDLYCPVPEFGKLSAQALEGIIAAEASGDDRPRIFLLPEVDAIRPADHSVQMAALEQLAHRYHVAICTTFSHEQEGRLPVVALPGKSGGIPCPTHEFPYPVFHNGPGCFALLPYEALVHPEMAVALSKLGCDMALLSETEITSEKRLVSGVKTIEKIGVALCAANGAAITLSPEGHQRWEEIFMEGPGVCHKALNTRYTRSRRYQDRLDFDLLLKNNG